LHPNVVYFEEELVIRASCTLVSLARVQSNTQVGYIHRLVSP